MTRLEEMLNRIEHEEVSAALFLNLMGSQYHTDKESRWNCTLEKKGNGLKLEAKGEGPTLEAALSQAYDRFFGVVDKGVKLNSSNLITATPSLTPGARHPLDESDIPF